MSMALVVVALLALVREMGLGAAVIRREALSPEFLSTVFWVNAVVSLFVAVAMVALSPLAAAWFDEPRLALVLVGLAPMFLLSGLSVIPQSILERTMKFGTVARAELASYVIGAIVAVGAAMAGAGVWSLVGQTVTQTFVLAALLAIGARWLPRRTFLVSELRSVAGFGGSLMGFNAVNFLSRNADNALVGRYLGAADLGFYALAYRLMQYPLQVVSTVVGRVTYPMFSRFQHDEAEVRRQYDRAIGLIGLVAFPLGFGMVAIPERVIGVLFGPAWAPAAGPLALLAPVAVVQVITTTVGPLYLVKGRADTMFRWGIFSTAVTVSGFVIGLQYGIIGVAASYLATTLLLLYPALAIPYRLINLKVHRIASTLVRPLAASAMMAGIVRILSLWIGGDSGNLAAFAMLVALGAATYGALSLGINRTQVHQLVALGRSL